MYTKICLEDAMKEHLPIGGEIIVSRKPYPRPLLLEVDIDRDGNKEVIGAYRVGSETFMCILKKSENGWYVLDTVQGKGSNVSYVKVAPITEKGANDIVVGWQVGAVWSELSIYQWNTNSLRDIAPANLYFSNIEVNSFGQSQNTNTIALWKHDTGDAYQVQLLRWERGKQGKLVPAYSVYPYYFMKVARYYKTLTKEFPHAPVYWYYLADAHYKAEKFAEALKTIEVAIAFDNPFPSREVLEALRNRVRIKEQQIYQNKRIREVDIIDALFPATVKTISGQKAGYIDRQGAFAIDPQFSYAMDFQDNGLAVVEDQSAKSGIINTQGEYVVKPIYNMITTFSEARAAVVDDQGYWIIDEAGRILTPKAYNYIGNFSERRAVFTDVTKQGDYLSGYLDRQGREAIPMKYRSGTDFHEGKAVVQISDNESALISLQGEVYQTYPYGNVGAHREGLLSFQEEPGGKFGYMNEQGDIVIEPKYTWAQAFEQGRAIVNKTDNYINETGLIDKQGKYIIEPKYNSILNLKESRYAVGKALDEKQPFLGSKYALADEKGKLLTDYMYLNISEYSQGVASVDDGVRTFFIDRKGEKVKDLPSIVGTGTMTLEGDGSVIKVNIDMRIFYLDRAGKVIWRQNKVIPLKGSYKVLEKKFKPNKDYLVYLPVVEGMKDKQKQQEVNRRLKRLSEVKPIERDAQLDYSYTGDFAIRFFRKQLLVLELSGYNFPFGAAHGMPTKIYPHVDLVSGEFYQLADLFKENSKYVKVLSEIIGKQIKTDPQYSYVFPGSYKGIKPDQPFYVTRNALNIYFAPYEILPYAAGFPTFTIPFAEIQTLINKQGGMWKAFHYEKV